MNGAAAATIVEIAVTWLGEFVALAQQRPFVFILSLLAGFGLEWLGERAVAWIVRALKTIAWIAVIVLLGYYVVLRPWDRFAHVFVDNGTLIQLAMDVWQRLWLPPLPPANK